MKKQLLILTGALLISTSLTARPLIAFPRAGLEISCSVSQKNVTMRDYRILIIENDSIYDTIYADLALPIFIQLDLNKSYLLEFSKPGFLERHILIDTKVPDGKDRRRYTYDFEIEMPFRYCDTGAYAVQPVARIIYDNEEEEFTHDKDYAATTGNIPTITVTDPGKSEDKTPAKKRTVRIIARKKI